MKKTKVLILICSILSATWLFVAGGIKYEAILDFCFSYADEKAQIDNERMRWQTEGSVKKFLTEVSLQRIWRQFCENNVDYYISKEVVSNVVFGCEIKGVDKERHMYQIKLVAPSKMLADKTVQFIFLTYQKSLEERIEVVFQKNAAKIGDLHKREELRKLINADSLRIKMYGDVKIRKIMRFNLWCK